MIEEKLYKKIQEVLPICCVDVVIFNKNKEFLLLKRRNEPVKGYWWIPGGRILKGELIEKAALRKAKEETGLDVKIKKLLGAKETIFKKGIYGSAVHTVNIIFLAEVKNGKVKMDSQSSEYKWFSKIDKNFHPYIKKFIKLGLAEKT